VAHLARGHQFGHGADGFLDRHVRVASVHVVEVDDVGLQPLQAFVDAPVDIGGVAARIEPRGRLGRP
jgi:hypothetical protein